MIMLCLEKECIIILIASRKNKVEVGKVSKLELSVGVELALNDYLVFAFDYVIKHKMKLNYPNGFKYYVEKPEIKAAYRKSKFEKVDQSKFTVEASNFDAPQKTEPSPLISKRPQGFGSILRHKKKD